MPIMSVLRESTPPTLRLYAFDGRAEVPVEAAEKPVGLFPRRGVLSSNAASAGESVSELIAEITVEMAMVSANCL